MGDELKHTHYSPYGKPQQVPGTLLDCTDKNSHRVESSELWADYSYSPRFGPASATGLPQDQLLALMDAYMKRRSKDTSWQIVDVLADDDYTYRVKITNRTMYAPQESGPTWHTEEWGIYATDGQWHGIPKNPHPGYEHWSSFCPNCGY
jgi:hypothetical protein